MLPSIQGRRRLTYSRSLTLLPCLYPACASLGKGANVAFDGHSQQQPRLHSCPCSFWPCPSPVLSPYVPSLSVGIPPLHCSFSNDMSLLFQMPRGIWFAWQFLGSSREYLKTLENTEHKSCWSSIPKRALRYPPRQSWAQLFSGSFYAFQLSPSL